MDYLIECSRTAREELLQRVKHRDSYLKQHLLVQAGLLAMSLDVEIAGIKTSGAVTYSLYLAIPLTLLFAFLYYTEDRLIGQLSAYIGSLSRHAESGFFCWDASPQLREYAETTVGYRFVAHLFAFCLAPAVLLALLYLEALPDTCMKVAWMIGQVIILIILLGLSVKEFRYRKSTGVEPPTIEK